MLQAAQTAADSVVINVIVDNLVDSVLKENDHEEAMQVSHIASCSCCRLSAGVDT